MEIPILPPKKTGTVENKPVVAAGKRPPMVPVFSNGNPEMTDESKNRPNKLLDIAAEPARLSLAAGAGTVEATGKILSFAPKAVEEIAFDPGNLAKNIIASGVSTLDNLSNKLWDFTLHKDATNLKDKEVKARADFKQIWDDAKKKDWKIPGWTDISRRSTFSEDFNKNFGEMSERSSSRILKIGGMDPANLTIPQKVANSIGSSVPSVVAAYLTGGASAEAQTGGILSKFLTKGAAIGASAIEGMQNADEVYRTLKKQGKTDREATDAAAANFVIDAAVGYATDRLGIYNENIKGWLARAVASTPPEVLQELGQLANQNINTGRPLTEGFGETALITSIMAPIMGGGIGLIENSKNKKALKEIDDAINEEITVNGKKPEEVKKDLVEKFKVPQELADQMVDKYNVQMPSQSEQPAIAADNTTTEEKANSVFDTLKNEIPETARATAEAAWKKDHSNEMADLIDEELSLNDDIQSATDEKQRQEIQSKLSEIIQKQEDLKDSFVESQKESTQISKKKKEKTTAVEKIDSESKLYADLPDKIVVDEEYLKNNESPYKKIKETNTVHFNQGMNKRVSLIVPTQEKMLINYSSKMSSKKTPTYKKNQAKQDLQKYANDNDISLNEAKKKAQETYEKYKAIADQNAVENEKVIVNTFKNSETKENTKTVVKEQSKKVDSDSAMEVPVKQTESVKKVDNVPPGKSRVYENIKSTLGEFATGNNSFDQINLEEESKKAADFYENDPVTADKIIMGLQENDTGINTTSLAVAGIEKARESNDLQKVSDLSLKLSLDLTKKGQDISAIRSLYKTTESYWTQSIQKARLAPLLKKRKSLGGKSRMDKKVETLEKVLKSKEVALQVSEFESFLDSITC